MWWKAGRKVRRQGGLSQGVGHGLGARHLIPTGRSGPEVEVVRRDGRSPGWPLRWSFSKAEPGAVLGLGCNEAGDARDRSKVIDLEILERHVNGELLFQMRQEFDERERVHQPGVDQVRVQRRNLKVQLLSEQGGDLMR